MDFEFVLNVLDAILIIGIAIPSLYIASRIPQKKLRVLTGGGHGQGDLFGDRTRAQSQDDPGLGDAVRKAKVLGLRDSPQSLIPSGG